MGLVGLQLFNKCLELKEEIQESQELAVVTAQTRCNTFDTIFTLIERCVQDSDKRIKNVLQEQVSTSGVEQRFRVPCSLD